MFQYDKLSYLYPQHNLSADLKTDNEDFIVDEIMPVLMSGEGEHSWLQITKKNTNTDTIATLLAKHAGVKPVAVSYAGLKDRHAVTTQWFSVHLPGMPDPVWDELESDELKINQIIRHNRKLKRGALSGNRFEIRLRQIKGDQSDWEQRLKEIAENGVPNYFGKQRFGHQMKNLSRALELIEKNKLRRMKPHKRGIYLSAMRSWIFNQIVSQRISGKTFSKAQSGDVMMLADSHACFAEEMTAEIESRLDNKELHITAAMWGKGSCMVTDSVEILEHRIADQYVQFADSLEKAGMKQERRAMRLLPAKMQWQFDVDKSLVIKFELVKGSYATALLRELADILDKSLPEFK